MGTGKFCGVNGAKVSVEASELDTEKFCGDRTPEEFAKWGLRRRSQKPHLRAESGEGTWGLVCGVKTHRSHELISDQHKAYPTNNYNIQLSAFSVS